GHRRPGRDNREPGAQAISARPPDRARPHRRPRHRAARSGAPRVNRRRRPGGGRRASDGGTEGVQRSSGEQVMNKVRAQFVCPTGWLGSIVGRLMAIKNRERSEWVLSQLGVNPGDRVLEIGFGPGVDVARTAAIGASVAGIDPSDVMVRQASRRNADAIRAGRVDLRRGAMPDLPFVDAAFDKAYSINSYQFWPYKTRALAELRRVMRPGGVVIIGVHGGNRGGTEDPGREPGEEMVRAWRGVGLGAASLRLRRMSRVAPACAIATV